MPSLDSSFALHEAALRLRSMRTELLASNLANADTPNYKARDIDFQSVLKQYQSDGAPTSTLRTTNSNHIQGANSSPGGAELMYRTPMQDSIDGNTVDTQIEKSEFMENAINYQATLTFIDGKMKSLKKALGGQ